ncbi:carboxylesterase/lipase family protein [Streptomyces sp. NPDC091217]|uniref:carboxylesterase/lipase family protein n=1 Tax=Streptomyces sp. NPDC091217 TaxID=3365975 RepID=UPI00380989B0
MLGSYTTVDTTAGTVRGVRAGGIQTFLGIPYGASVSGEHRFTAPRPVEPWPGVRDAFDFGPAAPQLDPRIDTNAGFYEVIRLLYPGVPTPLEGRPAAEDCLVLNVWASVADTGPKPVMVWLHGGGFVHGTGAEGWFQGDRLAASEDVVVVTVNHRLGVLGFLGADEAHPEDASGVAGMLDLVLALRWVRDNIAGFGGDPANVTVFGQSGGGGKVAALMAMPAARGLFHKAIMQSTPFLGAVDLVEAAKVRQDVLRYTEAQDLSQLRRAPLSAVLAAQAEVMRSGTVPFAPVWHPVELPEPSFVDASSAGTNHVPLLIGTTTHEFALMLAAEAWYHSMTAADLPGRFEEFFGSGGRDALARFSELEPDSPPQLVLARATTDAAFVRPTARLREAKAAQAAAVYAYRLDYRTEVLDGILGAHHSIDLPFVFGNVDRSPVAGTRPERFAVSAAMTRSWANFARNGVPGHDGLPSWPSFTESGSEMVFAEEPRVAPVTLPSESTVGFAPFSGNGSDPTG